jgi:hypothetical protein
MSRFLKIARGLRAPFGHAQAIVRHGEARAISIGVTDLSRNRTDAPAIAGRRELTRLWDDEEMPLICPTCQIVFRCIHAACYFAWGCFRYFNRDTAASALRLGA